MPKSTSSRGSEGGTAPRQGPKKVGIGMAGKALRDLLIEALDTGRQGLELADQRLHQEGAGLEDGRIPGQRHGPGDLREALLVGAEGHEDS